MAVCRGCGGLWIVLGCIVLGDLLLTYWCVWVFNDYCFVLGLENCVDDVFWVVCDCFCLYIVYFGLWFCAVLCGLLHLLCRV